MTFDWGQGSLDIWALGHWSLTIKFDQNWFMHFGDTLDNMVDRRKKKRNNTGDIRLCKKTV